MKEHTLILSAPMVRAVLNTAPGVWPAKAIDASKPFKWQTRRLVKKLRVRLRHEVRSDVPHEALDVPRIVATPGVYDATMHRAGAISIDVHGRELGVKPGEFDFVCPYSPGETSLAVASGRETERLVTATGSGTLHTAVHDASMMWQVQPGDDVWFRETWAHLSRPLA